MAVQEVYLSTLTCQLDLTRRCVFWCKWLNCAPLGNTYENWEVRYGYKPIGFVWKWLIF